jgi:excisionase family DNA binding protein
MEIPTTQSDAFVGTTEAASLLGITRQAVLKRIRAGTLPARKVGRNYVIPVDAVQSPLARDPVLADIVRRLVEGYDPERVYLFGSAARGDAGPDSDYDLMLVMPDGTEPHRMDPRDAYSGMLHEVDAPVDVLIMSRESFDRKSTVVGSLPEIVLFEGTLLYAS